ncbi:MAG: beta-ketoacyl synthase N-terminal-like domain-containing protein [Actinomycetota bacterium]|jgi:acetyl-CoA C-acetyltransferase
MRRVLVAGGAMTRFGARPEPLRELVHEAASEALRDAEVESREIDAVYFASALAGITDEQAGVLPAVLLRTVGIAGRPMLRIENACASGSTALAEAFWAVRNGRYRTVLVVGAEKMTQAGSAQAAKAMAGSTDAEFEGRVGLLAPAFFAMVARRHMQEHGTTREQMAKVAVKNHANGAKNPKAHIQREVTLEQVLGSAPVSDPLQLLDCCPVSDGAAAVVVTAGPGGRRPPLVVAGSGVSTAAFSSNPSMTSFSATRLAANLAYSMAELTARDVRWAEVHDCFTIAELLHYEDLQFCDPGAAGRLIEEGATSLGGRLPVNPSGGLKSRGHPLGATGVAQVVEALGQLRGEAFGRQVADPSVALVHTIGGIVRGEGAVAAVHILTEAA